MSSHYIVHPEYGKLLSLTGLMDNNSREHCNYCGDAIDKDKYVKHYGYCPLHYSWYEEDVLLKLTKRNRLKEISDFRLEEAGVKKGKVK